MLSLLQQYIIPATGAVLDLGGGTGRLLALLPEPLRRRAIVLDIEPAALQRARRRRLHAMRADFCALPMADRACALALSGMLSLNYAGTESRFRAALSETARVLQPGAYALLEIAAAWRPAQLQGMAEEARFGPRWTMRFRYDDMLEQSPTGAVLQSELELIGSTATHRTRAPLFVPALGALPEILREAGLELIACHAPTDPRERTLTPPKDCLRVWAACRTFSG